MSLQLKGVAAAGVEVAAGAEQPLAVALEVAAGDAAVMGGGGRGGGAPVGGAAVMGGRGSAAPSMTPGPQMSGSVGSYSGGQRHTGGSWSGGRKFSGGSRKGGGHHHHGHGHHKKGFAVVGVPFGFYDDYAYYPNDYGCYQVRRVHTRHGWQWRRVYVCDY
jgi:hypothetical protein